MPVISDVKIIPTKVEDSAEGFDAENIGKTVLAYILTCLPAGSASLLADMLNEYVPARKYKGDGYDEYMNYIRDLVKEKLV